MKILFAFFKIGLGLLLSAMSIILDNRLTLALILCVKDGLIDGTPDISGIVGSVPSSSLRQKISGVNNSPFPD